MPVEDSVVTVKPLIFYVNGNRITEEKPDPEMSLLTYLRTELRLTGAKLGCGEGGCGACTVMVSQHIPSLKLEKHYTINACLTPLCSIHGLAVTTVEGIGNLKNLHPVQERITKFHGSQCGFCTPGFVMSMYTLLRNNANPTETEVEENFDGNLCRCTGYRPILDGFRTFTKEFKCALGDKCCQNKLVQNGSINSETSRNGHLANGSYDEVKEVSKQDGPDASNTNCNSQPKATEVAGDQDVCSVHSEGEVHTCLKNDWLYKKLWPTICELKPLDPSQELIFPPDLVVNYSKYHGRSLKFTGPNVTWLQPATLTELVELKATHPGAKLVVGNTEIGVDTKLKYMNFPILIYTRGIPELQSVTVSDSGVTVGAAVTLSQLDKELKNIIKSLPEHKTRVLAAVVETLKWFGGHQIRNVASLAGNLMTASPISDLNPILLAAEATVLVQSQERGQRSLKVDHTFFCGYRRTVIAEDEVLLSITLPLIQENEYFAAFKQANRKEDDIAIVNAGMSVTLSKENKITKICLAFGGMGVTVVVAKSTMDNVIGEEWNDSLVSKVSSLLTQELQLAPDAPGGFVKYRQVLALSFFFKFFVLVRQQISKSLILPDLSAVHPLEAPVHRTIQVIGGLDSRLKTHDVVGQPIVHFSGLQQSTGEAMYVDDMPQVAGELHMALVVSTRAHAQIVKVDPHLALSSPGVISFISATDVPGVNSLGIFMDTVFAVDKVTCQGQIIGAVLAETQTAARSAARLVDVQYQDLQPVIITIEDAIKHESYYKLNLQLEVGDLQAGFQSSDHTLEGQVRIGGQNHFYLETMATRVVPGENDEMQVYSSTQDPTQLQKHISEVLGVPSNKIVVRVKRLGGAFGGKDTQALISGVPVAVAARKVGRPVRCVLDRDVDMVSTGNRHPFLGKYKVGFTKEGKILAADLTFYSNAGNSFDYSFAVMARCLLQIDAAVHIPHFRVVGHLCRTNILSSTAFRGFGAPQGHFIMETILDEVAIFLGLSSQQVQEANFAPPGSLTHYGLPAGGEFMRRCWDMCLDKSQYSVRKQQVDKYNRENRWKKRGLALSPLKFGISIFLKHMNQAGALVHIYQDGSVLVAHAGVEMGQGLYIKIAQVASQVLEIPLSLVHISETATNTIPNTISTCASISTDINGMAVQNACEILKERLAPIKQKMPHAQWKEIITAAYMERVSLSSTGFYATPDIGYDFSTQTGKPFTYFTYGAACSEVQIDCLTGDHKIIRTDIVMDVGDSINPAVDIGQIEGAFTQGCGLHLLEDLKVTPDGSHLTRGPGNYKIPTCGNIPAEFNVYLVPDSPNPKAVFASRAIGEPPLLLAASVIFAVKEAVRAARKDTGASSQFEFNSPALPSLIRLACEDVFTKQVPDPKPETYTPWTVVL